MRFPVFPTKNTKYSKIMFSPCGFLGFYRRDANLFSFMLQIGIMLHMPKKIWVISMYIHLTYPCSVPVVVFIVNLHQSFVPIMCILCNILCVIRWHPSCFPTLSRLANLYSNLYSTFITSGNMG